MTVKSPFYNKPSTLTSVDSCHKEPTATTTDQASCVASVSSSILQVQRPNATGFEPSHSPSSNSNLDVAEPGSASAAKTTDKGASGVGHCCSNCNTTTTPLWRRSPEGTIICNACGLYLKARKTTRPVWLKRRHKLPVLAPKLSPAASASPPSPPPHACCDPVANAAPSHRKNNAVIVCANCKTTNTPLWRRDEQGNAICNACGLYFKLHSTHRPLSMKRTIVKRRKRVFVDSPPTIAPLSDDAVTLRPLLPQPQIPPLSPPTSPGRPVEPDAFQKHPRLPAIELPPTPPAAFVPSTRQQDYFASVLSTLNEPHKELVRDALQRQVSELSSQLSQASAVLEHVDRLLGVVGNNGLLGSLIAVLTAAQQG